MVCMGLHKLRLRNYSDISEAAIRVGLLLLFVDLEMRTPFVRKLQPEEVWLYRNPMTDSYVPGDMLWKMVALVPVSVILTVFLVKRDTADLRAATLVATLAIPLNGVLTNIVKLCVGR
jgi:diacylglycerol diphosphate phosphatase / phosphatidate phosphatase